MSKENLTKVEFLLTLEGNIIIQRYFNVKDLNYDAFKSMDLYYNIMETCNEIASDLKLKTIDYLLENQNYYYDFDDVEDEKNPEKEYFSLEIKIENRIFISRIFPAHIYHPRARYVDLRPKIRDILSDLTTLLSSDNLDWEYLDYNLKERGI
jgi:hypothetical protein